MNTAMNSSPFAAWTVINCTASCPACAWLSPASSDACDKNPASGVILSGVLRGIGRTGGIEDIDGGIGSRQTNFRRVRRTRTQRNGPRGGIESVAFFLHESGRRVHDFLQVLQPVLPFALVRVMHLQPARAHHVLHGLPASSSAGFPHASCQSGSRMPPDSTTRPCPSDIRYGGGHRTVVQARRVGKLLDRARSDTARREVDHARKRGVVVGVVDETQIRKRMLHFLALEKPQSAIHPVRDPRIHQRVLDGARLRICSGTVAISPRDAPAWISALISSTIQPASCRVRSPAGSSWRSRR